MSKQGPIVLVKMELLACTKHWFSNISHTITYDSWKQFLTYEPGIQVSWKGLVLFTWGCKQEKDIFTLQLIYIDLEAKPNFLIRVPNSDEIGNNYIEKRCIQIKFKEEDTANIKKWLLERDPNFWNRDCLLRLPTPE